MFHEKETLPQEKKNTSDCHHFIYWSTDVEKVNKNRWKEGRKEGRKEGVSRFTHTYILNNDYVIIRAKNKNIFCHFCFGRYAQAFNAKITILAKINYPSTCATAANQTDWSISLRR